MFEMQSSRIGTRTSFAEAPKMSKEYGAGEENVRFGLSEENTYFEFQATGNASAKRTRNPRLMRRNRKENGRRVPTSAEKVMFQHKVDEGKQEGYYENQSPRKPPTGMFVFSTPGESTPFSRKNGTRSTNKRASGIRASRNTSVRENISSFRVNFASKDYPQKATMNTKREVDTSSTNSHVPCATQAANEGCGEHLDSKQESQSSFSTQFAGEMPYHGSEQSSWPQKGKEPPVRSGMQCPNGNTRSSGFQGFKFTTPGSANGPVPRARKYSLHTPKAGGSRSGVRLNGHEASPMAWSPGDRIDSNGDFENPNSANVENVASCIQDKLKLNETVDGTRNLNKQKLEATGPFNSNAFTSAATKNYNQNINSSLNSKEELESKEKGNITLKEVEQLHLAGNAAFQERQFARAIKLYERGKNLLLSSSTMHNNTVSVLLSNTAAASLALSRPYQALAACKDGLRYSPTFAKCALRMATCHCRLGNFSEATSIIENVMSQTTLKNVLQESNRKMEEITEVLKQTCVVLRGLGYTSISSRILDQESVVKKNQSDYKVKEENIKKMSTSDALEQLKTLHPQIPHAEFWFAARADILFRSGRFEDALLTLETLPHEEVQKETIVRSSIWRKWVAANCTFFMGRIKDSLQHLENILQDVSNGNDLAGNETTPEQQTSYDSKSLLSRVISVPDKRKINSIKEMLEKIEKLRNAGNDAMKKGRYEEASKAYSEALAMGTLSPAMAAVFYCNRAAANQGLRRVAFSIADSSFAAALSPQYAKPHSRLSSILANIGMLSSAAEALVKAIKIRRLPRETRKEYEKRLKGIYKLISSQGNESIVDYYQLLGLGRKCSKSDVRKAYRSLIMLHPDKTASNCRISSSLLLDNSSRDMDATCVVGDAHNRVKDQATWLFKCLGEAQDVLSDDSKRELLDLNLDRAYSRSFYR